LYGLGTLNQSLPGFVTIDPAEGIGGAQNYGSAFLPATFQGTRISAANGKIPNIANHGLSPEMQRQQLDYIQSLNRSLRAQQPGNVELDGVIESYELAFRMQSTVPSTLDLSKEPAHIRSLYGLDSSVTERFGTQCLMARRLCEAGVRFVQVTHTGWDQHNGLRTRLQKNCAETDKPIAALLEDLRQRGMLKDTLVLWGGEFGRTPTGQGGGRDGRQHNNRGYTMWLAGGGVKPGFSYGATDDLGGTAADGKMHTHDLHATLLHLLGLDHEKLTYRYAGRDFRLTDVEGTVATRIIA
jgi:hypothetical protein